MAQNQTYGKLYQAIDRKNDGYDILQKRDLKFLDNSDTFTYVNEKIKRNKQFYSKPIQVDVKALSTLSQTMILKSP